jgi:hypothetical protein
MPRNKLTMKRTFFQFIFATLLAISLMNGFILKTDAAGSNGKYSTIISFSEVSAINLGEAFTLSGYVRTWFGDPVDNQDVTLEINGTILGQARSDADGYFQRKFTEVYNAGTYKITAFTQETHELYGAAASTNLEILPADVQVQTVPAIAGVAFSIAGSTFYSGTDGIADAKVGNAGVYQLSVLVDQYNNPDQRIEFARWLDGTFQPSHVIQVPTNKVIQVGFNVYQKVGETFVDPGGNPVNPKRVSELSFRSAQGDLFVLKDGQPRWIPASRINRFQSGLVANNLMYSVLEAMVDGSNAVNASQQHFFAHQNDTWKISLILYTLRIRSKDTLFGSPAGKSINLVYPDGHVRNYTLDRNGTTVIDSLARGNYGVQVLNAKGLKQVIPVALSRSQEVNIKVLSFLDLGVVISLGLIVAVGLILVGRRQLRHTHSQKASPLSQDSPNALVKAGMHPTIEGKASPGRIGSSNRQGGRLP